MITKPGRFVSTAVLFLLAAAALELVARGPVRFAKARDFNDFLSPYIQARAWMRGVNPYSPSTLLALWPAGAAQPEFLAKDVADGSLIFKRGIPTAYPPTSLPVLALFAWLPWRTAHGVWLVTCLVTSLAIPLAFIRMMSFQWNENRTYWCVTLMLALAPIHTSLAVGSLVILVVGLCAAAVLAVGRERQWIGGGLIAVAVALKPQIGLPFLIYYLLRRRWSVAVPAAIALILLAAIALLPLYAAHVPWLDDYRTDNKVLFAFGSLGDFTEANGMRFSLINLQVITYQITGGRQSTNVATLLICAALGLVWLFLFHPTPSNGVEALQLTTLVVLSLLPVYHRLYDASLLVFPIAWAWGALEGPLRSLARKAIVPTLVFLVPGGSALEQLQGTGYLAGLQHTFVWRFLVMPHQVWALLALSVILLWAMWSQRQLQSERMRLPVVPVAT